MIHVLILFPPVGIWCYGPVCCIRRSCFILVLQNGGAGERTVGSGGDSNADIERRRSKRRRIALLPEDDRAVVLPVSGMRWEEDIVWEDVTTTQRRPRDGSFDRE